MMKTFVVLCALVSFSAWAGNADFDAYMNSNAKNKALTSKAKNQEAFAATQAYQAEQQDPQLQKEPKPATFKMGGTNTSGSFSGGSSGGSSGSGSFKPTSVTTKPVTVQPAAAPGSQVGNNQQPYFGTVGKNPVITNNSASGSGSTTQASTGGMRGCQLSSQGTKACVGGAYGPPSAYGGVVGGYVNSANQTANQQYYDSTAAAAAAAAAANQNAVQNTIQNVQVFIPR